MREIALASAIHTLEVKVVTVTIANLPFDDGFLLKTAFSGARLFAEVTGVDHHGADVTTSVATDKALTLFGQARGKRILALAGMERIDFDGDTAETANEPPLHCSKSAAGDDA